MNPVFIDIGDRTINLSMVTHIEWDSQSDGKPAVKVCFPGDDWIKLTPEEGDLLEQALISYGRQSS